MVRLFLEWNIKINVLRLVLWYGLKNCTDVKNIVIL